MRNNKRGFTLVEIMIVVAIIALLAAIAIPNLLRAKVTANDAAARATLRSLSTVSETYATSNNGSYPLNISSLTGPLPAGGPPYINTDYTVGTFNGFTFAAPTMNAGAYTFTATPATIGVSGTTTFTITTGGILLP